MAVCASKTSLAVSLGVNAARSVLNMPSNVEYVRDKVYSFNFWRGPRVSDNLRATDPVTTFFFHRRV